LILAKLNQDLLKKEMEKREIDKKDTTTGPKNIKEK